MSVEDFDRFHDEAYKAALEHATQAGFVEQVCATSGKVIVRRTAAPKTTTGGIILANAAKPTLNQGMVISADPETKFKPGDRVLFGQFAGSNQIKLNGEDLLVLGKDEICGLLTRVPVPTKAVKEPRKKLAHNDSAAAN